MKCSDCYDYGPILPEEALNDRLYWVELLAGSNKGGKFAAWRFARSVSYPWVISTDDLDTFPFYEDSEIRLIHEIIPED